MNSIRTFLRFVKPYTMQLIITAGIGFARNSIPMALPLLLMLIVDNVIDSEALSSEGKKLYLFAAVGGCAVLYTVIRLPIEYYSLYGSEWIGNRILYDLRIQLFQHIQKLSIRFFHNRRSGEIVSRMIHDVEQTKHFVTTGLINVWLDLLAIGMALVIMLSLHAPLALLAACVIPVYGICMRFFFGRFRGLSKERSQALSEVNAYLHERVQGVAVIRGFRLEEHEEAQFRKQNGQFLEKALEQTRWNAKTHAAVNTVTDVAPLMIIGFGGYQVLQGDMSVGALMAFYAYVERIYAPLRRLVNSTTHLTQSLASMDRVAELMGESDQQLDRPDAVKLPKDGLQGRIEFEHVALQYDVEAEPVLHNINLIVEPGEHVALVGMSGGGKSSLIGLIPRFYDVTEGVLRIDGEDVCKFRLDELRSAIGIVAQDAFLFSGTIADNIRIGNPDATDLEVEEAANAACAHEFIVDLPQAYLTPVGERGVKLSGGQRQRIALARLFLKNPSILLLDEATSALDLESEKRVQQAITRLSQGRTTLIVAHRLASIIHADRIVVVDRGTISETGSHAELLQRKGLYYDLYQIQLQGSERTSNDRVEEEQCDANASTQRSASSA